MGQRLFSPEDVYSGMIVMWSGLVSKVPAGWSVCDGTNGTPDLREKFVRGAMDEAGDTGGCPDHMHCVMGFASATDCSGLAYAAPGPIHTATFTHGHFIDGSASPEYHLPPYYELIFIRKD